MSSNQDLIQKADMAMSDLTSGGGVLNTEQSKEFVRRMITEPTLIKDCRTVGMGAPVRDINRIGFGSRILHAAEGVALNSGQRSKPTVDKITMTAKEFKAEIRLPYNVIEDAIESATAANNEGSNAGPGGIRTVVLDLIAKRAALDIEEVGLLSDLASGDADLATQEGWLECAKNAGNIVDISGAAISKSVFKKGKKAVPDQYLRNIGAMRHYVSVDQETEYRDTLADRATALGDAALQGVANVVAYGSPVAPVALMPEAKGLFLNPLNLIFGVWRRISLEFDKDISAGTYIIVLSTRIAFTIEEPEATVLYTNIG